MFLNLHFDFKNRKIETDIKVLLEGNVKTKLMTGWILILMFALSGCTNIFKSGSKKDSDEAIFEEIQKSVDASDWDTALTQFSSLSVAYKSRTDVIEAWAGVYAGKCGLNFLTYVDSLRNASLVGTTLFKYIMDGFTTTTVSPAHCDLAQAKMEEISALAAGRTADENLFMAVLGMVKMGTYLRSLADANQDGVTDPAFNSCSTASLSDANLNSIITGMGLVSDNIVSLAAMGVTGSLSTVTAQCGASCGIVDPAAVTALDRAVFRDLLKTGSGNPTIPAGIESCVDPLVIPCCP